MIHCLERGWGWCGVLIENRLKKGISTFAFEKSLFENPSPKTINIEYNKYDDFISALLHNILSSIYTFLKI
jgi:hypothetical protein